jgi:LemA protein
MTIGPAAVAGIVAVVLLAVLWLKIYNGLIGKRNDADNAFAGMDAMLKKRFDLVPNLVATVKQYMQHEANTLTKVTELRTQATSRPLNPNERMELENQLTKSLTGLMVAVENYPDLKASQNFLDLQGSLNEVEEQIAASRRYYNTAVTELNKAIQMFPASIVAASMHLAPRVLFSVPEVERQNPSVRDLFSQ